MNKHFRGIYDFQISEKNTQTHRIIRLANASSVTFFFLTFLYGLIYLSLFKTYGFGFITLFNSLGYLLYFPLFKKYSFLTAIRFISIYFLFHLTLIIISYASPRSGFQYYYILTGPLLHLLSIREENKRFSYSIFIISFGLFVFAELMGTRYSLLNLSDIQFRLFYYSSIASVFILLMIINYIYKKEFETSEKKLHINNLKLKETVSELGNEVKERKINEEQLQKALEEVQTLSGMLPICASCKNIRDDSGYWKEIEIYIESHTDAVFSHGLCPDCVKKLYPKYNFEKK